MNFKNTSCLLWKVLLIGAAAAAEPPSALSCNVTKRNEFVVYSLSRPPSSPSCTSFWEKDLKRIVLANYDGKNDPKLVHNRTSQSIILKVCLDDVYYQEGCEHHEEAHCRVNCSSLLDSSSSPTCLNASLVNSTSTPFVSETQGPEPWKTGLGVLGVVLILAAAFVGLYLWKVFRPRRGGSAAAVV